MNRLGRLAMGAMEGGWLTAVILIPLFIDKNADQSFEPPKVGLLRAIAVLMLVAWAAKQLSASRGDPEPAGAASFIARIARVPLLVPATLVLLATLLATLLSIAPAESFWGQRTRAQGALTLLAQLSIFAATLANLSSRRQLQRLVTALILPSVPIAAYAVFQRLGFEPLLVTGRDTDIQRATSLLGQPVFLAAYLGMVMPFTALRVVEAWHERTVSRSRRGVGVSVHAGVLLLQGLAALCSESRGALLGVLAALAVGFLTVAARRGWRRHVLWACALAAAAIALVALGRSPLGIGAPAGAEQARIARRAADTFKVKGGSGGLFRSTTWRVAERALRNQTPLQFADGSRDPLSKLRPLVGYGPEVQYAVSPVFYDARLPQAFKYFSADRYHNELWDVVVTTGLLGLAAQLGLQCALMWLLFRNLALVSTRPRARWFWAAYLGGAATGALGWSLLHGLPFVFLGLQTGALLGLALFLIAIAVLPRNAQSPGASSVLPHEGILVAALAALVSHLIEVSFSFTVTPTGTLFWIVSAMVVACTRFQRSMAAESDQSARAMAPSAPTEVAADGVLLGLALIGLGAAFLDAFKQPYQTGMVLWNGLTLLGQPAGARFPVVAILVAATLLFGTLLFSLQPDAPASLTVSVRARRIFASGALVGLVYWLALAFLLAHFGIPVQNTALLVSRSMQQSGAFNASLYVSCLLVVSLFALLCDTARTEPSSRWPPLAWWRASAAVGCALLGLSLIVRISLRPAAADAALALGSALEKLEQNALAEEAYRLATQLRPDVESYQAMLAKAYAEHARVDPAHAAAWYERADEALRQAIARSHIDTENATNLAGFRANWALATTGRRRAVLQSTVADLYARALRLNPQHPGLWRRWAITQLTLLHDAPGALESARHAVKLEPTRAAEAYALIAECQMALARSRTGEPRREGFLDAAASYGKAIELAPNDALYRASQGTALLDAGQPAEAAASLRAALAAIPAASPAGKSTADALKRAESSAALVATAKAQP